MWSAPSPGFLGSKGRCAAGSLQTQSSGVSGDRPGTPATIPKDQTRTKGTG
jgi:hypothetical protein